MPPNPVATYRLQLRRGFDLQQVAALVPYLASLGVSHVYLSPCLQAADGSTHGYDITDPTRIDAAVGGEAAFSRLWQTLQAAGLFLMIDLVPNHMCITARQNRWWWEVLENGPAGRFADYFDVDWQDPDGHSSGRVLLPVLGDHYGRILENGELILVCREGLFELRYHEHRFPVAPAALGDLLAMAAGRAESILLGFLADSCFQLRRQTGSRAGARRNPIEYADQVEALKTLLQRLYREEPQTAAAIDREVAAVNADPDALDNLVACQYYRLAHWRSAAGLLNYRRFFDINDLIGVRVEDQNVFTATHRLPVAWVREGCVHGLRIDHPDGLYNPAEYFQRLRAACPDAWILAEKILEPGEKLPADWPIDGTTGYDFLNLAGGLFINPQGLERLTDIYRDISGHTRAYPALVYHCKGLVLEQLFSSELDRLTMRLSAICEQHRRQRDYTRHELRAALFETAACFPVYRTYVQAAAGRAGAADTRYINAAVEQAMTHRPDLPSDLFRFLEEVLLLEISGAAAHELALRFQQLTGPVMAKGVEDTAFYRFAPLICCNEVGSDPAHYAVSPHQFHQACAATRIRYPLTLLAGSTHDTKRSEDVRARLALLSEIPERWAAVVTRWIAVNARYSRDGVPDRNTAYLFYQTLVGAWPITTERLTAYMLKAGREAKQHTCWLQPNQTWERSVHEFVTAVMQDEAFCHDVNTFVTPLVRPGYINSLAQTLLKLTSPGIPDIYQGTELWDSSLVDPDNRRPVDFKLRRRLLDEISDLDVDAVMARLNEGLPKLRLIQQTLHLRRRYPECFDGEAAYTPMTATGSRAAHVVACQRGSRIITIAPRLVLGLDGGWDDTALELPAGRWHNHLTDEGPLIAGMRLEHLLARFPVALLFKEEYGS